MPRYFFDVQDGTAVPDVEGTYYESPERACLEAVTLAGEMLKDLDGAFWTSDEWCMRVSNEQGATVCTLRISGTLGDA